MIQKSTTTYNGRPKKRGHTVEVAEQKLWRITPPQSVRSPHPTHREPLATSIAVVYTQRMTSTFFILLDGKPMMSLVNTQTPTA